VTWFLMSMLSLPAVAAFYGPTASPWIAMTHLGSEPRSVPPDLTLRKRVRHDISVIL